LFPLYDPAVAGRKDVLFFVAFALYAWWMPGPQRRWADALAFAAMGALAKQLQDAAAGRVGQGFDTSALRRI
jgi:hypothetical protein